MTLSTLNIHSLLRFNSLILMGLYFDAVGLIPLTCMTLDLIVFYQKLIVWSDSSLDDIAVEKNKFD